MTRKVFVGPTAQVSGGIVTLPWNRALIATIMRPEKVLINTVSANLNWAAIKSMPDVPTYTNPINLVANGGPGGWASGTRTGIPLEGPWLAYRAKKSGLMEQVGDSDAGEYYMRTIGLWDNTDELQWVFDLAVRRPIYLPYPGSLEIIGNLPGTWEVEVWRLTGGNSEVASKIDSELTLTAQIAPSADPVLSSRLFAGIPYGAHSFTYRDSGVSLGNFPKSEIWIDEGGKNDVFPPLGNALIGIPRLADYNNQSSQFYGRWGLANAVALKQFSSINQAVGEIQFHISLM